MTANADPEGAGRVPQHHVRAPVLRQTWTNVGFLHWRLDPTDVAPLLPDGVRVVVRDGAAWVSFVTFCTRDTRGPLPTPSLRPFIETNVRTYVESDDGAEAIWFLSLDAGSIVTTLGGLGVYGVPYHLARGEAAVDGDVTRYRIRRRNGGAEHDLAIRRGDPITDADRTDLDDWLTGRWRAYSRRGGRRLETRVEHEPWALAHAEVTDLHETLFAAVQPG